MAMTRGAGVVLVEADVVLALAELVGGAVQQPGNMVHGRADLVADSFVRAERNRGKPDRTGGAEGGTRHHRRSAHGGNRRTRWRSAPSGRDGQCGTVEPR